LAQLDPLRQAQTYPARPVTLVVAFAGRPERVFRAVRDESSRNCSSNRSSSSTVRVPVAI
jgi:hypothetical protein